MTKKINKREFEELVLQGKGVALVDFFATWCGPCKMLAPTLEQLSAEETDVNIYSVDVDEEQELAGKYSIFSVPTLLLFKNGELVDQLVGLQPKEHLREKLRYYNH